MNMVDEILINTKVELYDKREQIKPIIKSGLKDICDIKDKGLFTPKNTSTYYGMAKEMMQTLVSDMEIIDMFAHIFE